MYGQHHARAEIADLYGRIFGFFHHNLGRNTLSVVLGRARKGRTSPIVWPLLPQAFHGGLYAAFALV